jgi:hypothetical protein
MMPQTARHGNALPVYGSGEQQEKYIPHASEQSNPCEVIHGECPVADTTVRYLESGQDLFLLSWGTKHGFFGDGGMRHVSQHQRPTPTGNDGMMGVQGGGHVAEFSPLFLKRRAWSEEYLPCPFTPTLSLRSHLSRTKDLSHHGFMWLQQSAHSVDKEVCNVLNISIPAMCGTNQ